VEPSGPRGLDGRCPPVTTEDRHAEAPRTGGLQARSLGGSIDELFFCFGDYDLVGIVDFPDNRAAAAWSMAVSSHGDVRAFKTTTTLLVVEEGLHALDRASEATRVHHRERAAPARKAA
jgi:uncharacterized protein with GYD domain